MFKTRYGRALKPTSRPVRLLISVLVGIWLIIILHHYGPALLIFAAWMLFIGAGQALIRWLWQRWTGEAHHDVL